MAIARREPDQPLEPDVQRVRGGRRAALLTVVVGVAVVGTLVWKPWDNGAPAASRPSGSLPAVAVATASLQPTFTATAPTIEPSIVPGPPNDIAPGELGSVTLDPGGDAFVYCVYGGPAGSLISMTIKPPIVFANRGPLASSVLKRVSYTPEIETNSQQSIFSADWIPLTQGATQRRSAAGAFGAQFDIVQMKVQTTDLSASGVVRVAVVINWLGKSGETLATQRLYPTSYAPLGDASADSVPEGCPTRN
jgi:hypothetical protein